MSARVLPQSGARGKLKATDLSLNAAVTCAAHAPDVKQPQPHTPGPWFAIANPRPIATPPCVCKTMPNPPLQVDSILVSGQPRPHGVGEKPPPAGGGLSTHILPTSATMIGVC